MKLSSLKIKSIMTLNFKLINTITNHPTNESPMALICYPILANRSRICPDS